jgi:hypothetical protein
VRLEADCSNCQSKVAFNTWEETRADYARNKGKSVVLPCKNCGLEKEYHINDFTAKSRVYRILSKIVLFGLCGPMAGMLGIAWVASGFDLYVLVNGIVSYSVFWMSVPLLLYTILITTAKRREKAYNSYQVKQ